MEPLSVMPMHPPQSRQLNVLDRLLRAPLRPHRSSDEFGLVVAVDGLGQCVVVAIPDGSD